MNFYMMDVIGLLTAPVAELAAKHTPVWLKNAAAFFKKVFGRSLEFINAHPAVKAVILILAAFGCLGVIVSLVTAVIRNRDRRLKNDERGLYYNWFSGTRTATVRAIRSEYFKLLFSNLWNKSCIYYWVHSFGELFVKSRVIGMLAGAPYLVFGAAAIVEFAVKIVVGIALAVVLIPAELIVYAVTKAIALITCPIASGVSKSQLKAQHCLSCYSEFKKPVMKCPGCGAEHEYISPGEYGLFFARCTCGKLMKIMPKYQQNYSFVCPECGSPIAANRNRQTYIGVVAGDGAWEAKFIRDMRRDAEAAFTGARERLFYTGSQGIVNMTDPSAQEPMSDPYDANALALCSDRRLMHCTDSLVFYALPAQRILNESFGRPPLLMGQLDGIALLIDLTKKAVGTSIEDQPEREMEGIVSLFIQQFYSMTGQKANRLSPVNVAVAVIDDGSANADEADCMRALDEKGYGPAIAQLQSVFKNIRFFAADKNSVTGAFGPELAARMIPWLSKGCGNAVSGNLAKQAGIIS